MSAFNTLVAELPCPNCVRQVHMRVQFKYGDSWQVEYQLGDKIRWGGNDVGEPGHRRGVVDGAGEPCPQCGSSGDFEILLEADRIDRVAVASGRYDFVGQDEAFIVLEGS